MRLPSFLRGRSPARAIYYSATPLFDFRLASVPLRDGSYRHARGEPDLAFRREDTHYVMSGGTPDTVTLIPVASRPGQFIFQQSDGIGVAFYGVARMRASEEAFSLFSPEGAPARAIEAARGIGAVITDDGCLFLSGDLLISALVPVAGGAAPESWNLYELR